MTDRPTALALRALGLGDLLTTVPALRAIARRFPQHRRVLVAPASTATLLEGMGVIDDVVDLDAVRSPDALRRLCDPRFGLVDRVDVAVNLHGRGPESSRALASLRPRRLIAYGHPAVPEASGGPPWCETGHEVRRWCRLLEDAGVAADASDLHLEPADCAIARRHRDATVLHPGASSEARRWPEHRWVEVAIALRREGERVVLTGDVVDQPRCARIGAAAGVDRACDLSGRTSLRELAALLAASRAVVVGDTGVAHLATAVRAASVVLFGPEPPSRWGPPDVPEHRVLWHGSSGDPHAEVVDVGLDSITSLEVLHALRTLPTRRATSGRLR